MPKPVKLETLKVGDAFTIGTKRPRFSNGIHIALALTPDPFEVFCLDVDNRKIVELEEATIVLPLDDWRVPTDYCRTNPVRGGDLEVLY